MLLAADVGNTEIVLGVFDGASLAHTWRLSTRPERTADELALHLEFFLEHRGLEFTSLDGYKRDYPAALAKSPLGAGTHSVVPMLIHAPHGPNNAVRVWPPVPKP